MSDFCSKEASTDQAPSCSCKEQVRKIVEHCRKKKLLFWQTMLSHSQDYVEVLGLTESDIIALVAQEFDNNKKFKKGFYSLTIENKKFFLIPGCDCATNYSFEPNFTKADLKVRWIIMAYCTKPLNLNEDNGQKKPWRIAPYEREQLLNVSCGLDSCDDIEEDQEIPWANIIPEDWHQKILVELKK